MNDELVEFSSGFRIRNWSIINQTTDRGAYKCVSDIIVAVYE